MSDLPKGWTDATFADVSRLDMGQSPVGSATNSDGIGVPLIGGAADYKNDSLQATRYTTAPTKMSEPGDLILCIRATIGKVAVADREYCLGRGVAGLRPIIIESRFFKYFLLGQAEALAQAGTGTTFRQVDKKTLLSWPISVPPLNEQRRIVAKLDDLFARSKRARAELARVPTLVERLRQTVLVEAFSGGMTQKWREESFSDISAWSVSVLGEIADVGTGATPKRGNARYYQGGTIPWVTSAVVNEAVVYNAEEMITEDAIRETNCKVYPIGTLLVAMYGEGQTRGRVSVLGIEAATNQALAAIQVKESSPVLEDFLLWYLRSQYLEIRQKAAGGVQPNLNLGIIKALRIPVPSKDEQTEIIRRLEEAVARIDSIALESTRGNALLDRLEQATLTTAFQGDLVPQDPDDEPATVLLERIREARATQVSEPKPARTRSSTMTKLTADSLKEKIFELPHNRFSFEELRTSAGGDYEVLREMIFELLGETQPVLTQVFDEKAKEMRFVRVQQ